MITVPARPIGYRTDTRTASHTEHVLFSPHELSIIQKLITPNARFSSGGKGQG